MKKVVIFFSLFLVLSSCSKNLEQLNRDLKNVSTAAAETFFSNAVKNLSDFMSIIYPGPNIEPGYQNVFRLFSQQLTQVTYVEESNYFINDSRVSNDMWDVLYRDVLRDLKESSAIISQIQPVDDGEAIKLQNQLSVVEIMEVFTYAMLVETFGDVPYSEALNPEVVLPKYDAGSVIYEDLLQRLSIAIDRIDTDGDAFSTGDLLYQGDASKWLKFGNSLKLKMGLRIIDVDPSRGEQAVTEAIAAGVFSSNSDNATLQYLNSPPNTNPLWVALVLSRRQYYVGSTPFVSTMNTLDDPRRSVFFGRVDGEFVGGDYGLVQQYSASSPMGSIFFEPTLPGILLDYATVAFLLAEAVEREIYTSSADAAAYYHEAIKASFDYYGVSGIDAYLAQPEVNYITAAGSWKEKIGLQKWLALYNQGHEAWTEYRRLDYPELSAPTEAFVDVVPTRLTYPISEQTLNGNNYQSASAAIGGDLLTTKLFWDVH